MYTSTYIGGCVSSLGMWSEGGTRWGNIHKDVRGRVGLGSVVGWVRGKNSKMKYLQHIYLSTSYSVPHTLLMVCSINYIGIGVYECTHTHRYMTLVNSR